MEKENIKKLLESSDWDKKYLGLKKIKEMKLADYIDDVIVLIDDNNVGVRVIAIQAMGEIGTHDNVEYLLRALADPEEWVRIRAVQALEKIGNEEACPMLIQFLESELNEKVRATILKVLPTLGTAKIVPIVSLYLRDPDQRVRANAVEALEKIGATNIKSILMPYIEDTHHRIKANVAKALWSSGNDEWLSILKIMVRDKDPWTRAAAAWALGEIKSEAAWKILVDGIGDEIWFVDKNIIKSLKKHGSKTINILMRRFRKSEDIEQKNSIIKAIGSIGSENSTKFLVDILNNTSSSLLRNSAEHALEQISKLL